DFPVLWFVSIKEGDNGVSKAYFHWLGTIRYLDKLEYSWHTSPIVNSTVIALWIPDRSSLSQPGGKACLATPQI
ncbi:uncharacterized protein PgNI_03203, partial [Pyricularia grisea]|uniref:Uncharacterized protein n=1 Tax=Pyricularia grisea TaxID=148305 RepID=A0A6P8BC03_PYRGI